MTKPHQLKSRKRLLLIVMLPVLALFQLKAGAEPETKPPIDFEAFLQAAHKAGEYRKDRKVSFEEFQKMTASPNTVILDTRSKANYERKHLCGAVHLNFSEITTADLEKVIPSKDTRILIYCNNNFKNNSPAFPLKRIPMALNIPTFITLYDYGYRNLYELGDLLDETNPKVQFESTK